MSALVKSLQRATVLAVLVAGVVSGDRARAEDAPAPPHGLSGTFGESVGGSAAVVPATGGMSYSVPFDLPANRGSAQPRLELAYASGSRAGEAGWGWSLTLPSIERAPLSNWPKYIDNGAIGDEDRYAYNGQPLTFVCVVGGAPACAGTAVGPMPEGDRFKDYRHYRLQVEGSFERFFLSPDRYTWVIQRRGGEELELGSPLTRPDLVMSQPFDADSVTTKPFRWMLAVKRDLHGPNNLVYYRWAADSYGARKYLRDVFYTPPAASATTAPLTAFAYHVELRWEMPPYRQADFTFAERRPHRRRLQRVAISAKTWQDAGERELVRAYNLAYYDERSVPGLSGEAPLWGRSSLRSVQLEGRCAAAVTESDGYLPFPTGCPLLPPTTFDYERAQLATGTATRTLVTNGAGTGDGLTYPTSASMFDINRDGLPDIVQAWPVNYDGGATRVQYHDCKRNPPDFNQFAVWPGPTPEEPKLGCIELGELVPEASVLRSAREHRAWLNRGPAIGGVSFQHHCLDAGGVGAAWPLGTVTEVQVLSSSDPKLFTYLGAQAVGQWGDRSVLWSVAGYKGFGIEPVSLEQYPAAIAHDFCPESATNPLHPALRWTQVGEHTGGFAKDPPYGGDPELFRHYGVLDIDGDGYADLLVEQPGTTPDHHFRPASLRLTRRIPDVETVGVGASGPGLFPVAPVPPQLGVQPTITPDDPLSDGYSAYADINGDGIVDLVTSRADVEGGAPVVRLGNGRGGFSCEPAVDAACVVPGNGSWLGPGFRLMTPDPVVPWPLAPDFSFRNVPTSHFFHDVTGDGLADLVAYSPATGAPGPSGEIGRIALWVNVDGRTLRCANGTDCVVATIVDPDQPGTGVGGPTHRVLFLDVDANGTQDFVLLGKKGLWSFSFLSSPPVPGVGPRSPTPGLLTKIDNGVGAITEVVYQTVQDLDRAANEVEPAFLRQWDQHVPDVLPVVTRLTTTDTAGVPAGHLFKLERTTRFQYRDPRYDAWEQRFKGFKRVRTIFPTGEVEQRWFNFGPCEDGPFSNALGCLHGSDGGATRPYDQKSIVGKLVRIDRFVPEGGQEPQRWLSTTILRHSTEATFISLPEAPRDRPVGWSPVVTTDTYLYDTQEHVFFTEDIAEPPEQPGSRVRLRVETTYDAQGNVASITRKGRVTEAGVAVDDVITTYFDQGAPTPRCKANWACAVNEVRTVFTTAEYPLEIQLRRTKYTRAPDTEDVTEISAWLSTPSREAPNLPPAQLYRIEPSLGVPAPSTAVTAQTWHTLASFDVDAFGNVTRARGPTSPNTVNRSCTTAIFDTAFKQFPAFTTHYAGGDCTGTELTTSHAFDRGFGAETATMYPNETMETIELDAFGRAAKVYVPVANGGPYATELSVEITHHTQAPASWIEVKRWVDVDQYIASIDIMNGVGEHVLGFDQADTLLDQHPWVLRDWTERSQRGQVSASYRPWFTAQDPESIATNPFLLGAAQTRGIFATHDPFGRVSAVHDGPLQVAAYVHRPLEVHVRDAEQLNPAGPHGSHESAAFFDGHGRTVRTETPGPFGPAVTETKYLGTGEPTKITRSSVNPEPRTTSREMTWDSFGRMIINHEPNTSSGGYDWRYVYDLEGRLVGTSDARGCGKNLFYDALGRPTYEDFSPCLAPPAQPAYTAPNPVTGDGTEAFFRYDSYEPGQYDPTPDFDHRERLAVGQLVSAQDRGGHTRLAYDDRGRVRRVSRRVVLPGEPASSLATRYAPHWFKQDATFDIGDRLRKRTSGADEENLLVGGESFESMTYTARGALRKIGSSYGDLVKDLTYEASGAPAKSRLGDAASTRVERGYDSRGRLNQLNALRDAPAAVWTAPPSSLYPVPGWETTQLDLMRIELTYDDVGNPLSINDGSGADWPDGARKVSREFEYDPAYRLRGVLYTHGGGADPHVSAYAAEAAAGDRRPVPERTGSNRVQYQEFSHDDFGNVFSSWDNENMPFERSFGQQLNGKDALGQTAGYGPDQLIDGTYTHSTYDPAGNMTELTVSRDLCATATPDCSHRFLYEWDEVGQLVHAQRWDFPAGAVPAHDPNAPPVWDLRFAHGESGRTLTTKTDALGESRHTLDALDTLRVSDVVTNIAGDDYVIYDKNEELFLGGVARVFYDREQVLPQAGGSPLHVYLNIGDHLGSTAFVVDKDSGEVVERTAHQAYGKVESDYRPTRWAANREAYKFTGKEEDIEVGVTYFGARFYSPHVGRWMSADPLTIHGLAGDPNPYAYVSGRVSAYVDPLGLSKSCGDNCTETDEIVVEGTPPSAPGTPTPGETILDETQGGDPSARVPGSDRVRREVDRIIGIEVKLVKGTQRVPVPFTEKSYWTPNGVRLNALNAGIGAVIGAIDPGGVRHIVKGVSGVDIEEKASVQVGDDDDDVSELVGGVAMLAASAIAARPTRLRIGPRWVARSVTDPRTRTGCERVAKRIQKLIGGVVRRITPKDKRASNLGGFQGHSPGWAHHEVVVKDGRVYDAFTGHQGMAAEQYKALWEHAGAIDFGF